MAAESLPDFIKCLIKVLHGLVCVMECFLE